MKPLSSDQKFQTLKPKLVALGLLTLGATVVAIFSAATARGQSTRLYCSQTRYNDGLCSQVGRMYDGSLTNNAERQPQRTAAAASSGSSGSSPTTNDCTNITGDNPRCFRVMNEQNGLDLGAGTGAGTSGSGNSGLTIGFRRDTLGHEIRLGGQLGLGEERGMPVAANGNIHVHLGTPGSASPRGTFGGILDINGAGDLVPQNGQPHRFDGTARIGAGLTFFTAEQIRRASEGGPQDPAQRRTDRVFGREYLRGFAGLVAGVGLRHGASLEAMNGFNLRVGACFGTDNNTYTGIFVLRTRAQSCFEQVLRTDDGHNFTEVTFRAEVNAALNSPEFQRWLLWARADLAATPWIEGQGVQVSVSGGISYIFGARTPTLVRPQVEGEASGRTTPLEVVQGTPIDTDRADSGTAHVE